MVVTIGLQVEGLNAFVGGRDFDGIAGNAGKVTNEQGAGGGFESLDDGTGSENTLIRHGGEVLTAGEIPNADDDGGDSGGWECGQHGGGVFEVWGLGNLSGGSLGVSEIAKSFRNSGR